MHRLVALLLLRRRQIRAPLVDWWVEEHSEEGGYNQTDYQLAENTIGELEIEAGKEGTVMIDSTITLVSNSEGDATADADCTDVRLEDVNMRSDSPLKKSSKRRFESGTTSIPGIFFLQLKLDNSLHNFIHLVVS